MVPLLIAAACIMDSPKQASFLPGPELNLNLTAPISTWDEGIPLGNGLLGGLLWGGGNTLNVSLDRGDLWDERPAKGMQWEKFTYKNLVEFVKKKDRASIDDIFERAYNDSHPSKLPAGRMVLDLGKRELKSFHLDLAVAEGQAKFGDGTSLTALWSAEFKAGILTVPGTEPVTVKLMTPAMVAMKGASDTGPDSHGVGKLGYPKAVFGEETNLTWYEQTAADGLRYVVAAGKAESNGATRVAVTVTSTLDGTDPLKLAKSRISTALRQKKEKIDGPHRKWWKSFWQESKVQIPDQKILSHYYLVRYFYGAASRIGSPPMPLQGVWTADAGTLPPWKGDYHNDLNTQMTYMGYQTAGQFDSGLSYINFLWDRRDRFRRFAKEFYGTEGLSTPGVMTLAGEPLAGWVQYSLSPTMTAWSAHLFYLHWRYTNDHKFLKTRAYPWCREAAICIEQLLKEDDKGRLVLPTSSSPEIFDDSDRAWLKPNSNYDLMSMRMLFLSLVEMAEAMGDKKEAAKWQSLSDRLGDYHVRPDGTLKLNEVEDLPEPHRHLSNLMGIHPFNLITSEGSSTDRQRIVKSLEDWKKQGTGAWVGYSFSWMSALQARVGNTDEAHRLLKIFTDAFILRNGFHANGDQSGKGYSGFRYRPFTLEGNFLAMHALNEMLLQSWSPTPGVLDSEIIRVFPAIPDSWPDASFENLRAEGGYRVSAKRSGGKTVWLEVISEKGGKVRIKNSFQGQIKWSKPGVSLVGSNYEIQLKPGEKISGSMQ